MEQIAALGVEELQHRRDLADLDVLTGGITFTVYADGRGVDRAWPFDVVPRVNRCPGVTDDRAWAGAAPGRAQLVIGDLCNEHAVVADDVFPAGLLTASPGYLPECRGMRPAFGVWAHICGTDLVRDRGGTVYVLEDNLRIPSGSATCWRPGGGQADVRRPVRVIHRLGAGRESSSSISDLPRPGLRTLEHPGFHAHLVLCDAASPGGSAVMRLPGLEPRA